MLEVDGNLMSVSGILLETLTVKSPDGHIISRFAQFDIANSDPDRSSALQMSLVDCGQKVSFSVSDLDTGLEFSPVELRKYNIIVVCLV